MASSKKRNVPAIAWTVAGLASLVLMAVLAIVNYDDGEGEPEETSALSSVLPDESSSDSGSGFDEAVEGGDDFYLSEPSEPVYADSTPETEVEETVTDDDIADVALMMAIADAPGESATWPEDKVRSQAELVCDLRNETPDQNLDLALMLLVDSGAEGIELEDRSYFYGVAWVWCEETGR